MNYKNYIALFLLIMTSIMHASTKLQLKKNGSSKWKDSRKSLESIRNTSSKKEQREQMNNLLALDFVHISNSVSRLNQQLSTLNRQMAKVCADLIDVNKETSRIYNELGKITVQFEKFLSDKQPLDDNSKLQIDDSIGSKRSKSKPIVSTSQKQKTTFGHKNNDGLPLGLKKFKSSGFRERNESKWSDENQIVITVEDVDHPKQKKSSSSE